MLKALALLAAAGSAAAEAPCPGCPPHPGLSAGRRAAFKGHGPHLASELQPAAGAQARRERPTAQWHTQVLDHFGTPPEAAPVTWKQRYYVNDTLWGGPGFPVFLYIGGEGAESGGAISGELFMSHLAEKHQALMVDVEHRFYGESHPTDDMADNTLRYLTSQQGLEDLSTFVGWFSESYGDQPGTGSSKWVCFGGSYPGDLSAWFRLKYPHLVVGAVASSAPVLAKVDMPDYMDVVGRSLRREGGDACFDKVVNGTKAFAAAMATGATGMLSLSKTFQTCEPLHDKLDAATLVGDIMGTLQGIVQGNHVYSANESTISIMCGLIEEADSALGALLPLASGLKNQTGRTGGPCRDVSYTSQVTQLKNATWGDNMARQWTWQTCNEFGFFQSAGGVESPFNLLKDVLDENYYLQMCADVYGEAGGGNLKGGNWTVPVAKTNGHYGARALGGSRIVVPDGSIDPWHSLALTQPSPIQLALNITPVLIDGTTHCGDMYYPRTEDGPSLVGAREAATVPPPPIDATLRLPKWWLSLSGLGTKAFKIAGVAAEGTEALFAEKAASGKGL